MSSLLTPTFKVSPAALEDDIKAILPVIFYEMEELYGARDTSHSIASVFVVGKQSFVHKLEQGLEICLVKDVRTDRERRIATLAHECVHCLNYVCACEVAVLEEGAAEAFSEAFSLSRGIPVRPSPRLDYQDAHKLVKKLQIARPDVIRDLRVMDGSAPPRSLSSVTAAEIQALCPSFPASLAHKLVRKFKKARRA